MPCLQVPLCSINIKPETLKYHSHRYCKNAKICRITGIFFQPYLLLLVLFTLCVVNEFARQSWRPVMLYLTNTYSQLRFQLTVSVHSNIKAFLQSTSLALVSPGHVYGARPFFFALVDKVPSNTSLKEAPAAIACQHSVVLPRGPVTAHFTRHCLLFCQKKKRFTLLRLTTDMMGSLCTILTLQLRFSPPRLSRGCEKNLSQTILCTVYGLSSWKK